MKPKRLLLAGLLAALLGGALSAHHSPSDFLLDKDATIEGTIRSIAFRNPHVLINVQTSDSTVYTVQWEGAAWLRNHPELVSPRQAPVTSDTLKFGDHIIVVGAPPREPELRALVNLKELRRPADGWVWTCRPRASQMMC